MAGPTDRSGFNAAGPANPNNTDALPPGLSCQKAWERPQWPSQQTKLREILPRREIPLSPLEGILLPQAALLAPPL